MRMGIGFQFRRKVNSKRLLGKQIMKYGLSEGDPSLGSSEEFNKGRGVVADPMQLPTTIRGMCVELPGF